jgi:pseudaminic acid synthase
MIQIGSKITGTGQPCLIVAEISGNHNQQFELAAETIRAAKRAGADAVKLQTYTPDTITIDCENHYFKDILKGTIWEEKKFYGLYKQTFTPWEWHGELFRVAREEGLVCFSSPFDKTAVDFLEQLDPPAYKIASFEIQDIPLIEYAASKGKPMIISTGIATLEDIDLAVKTCRETGNENIVLLKCTSSYPASLSSLNLKVIPELKKKFGVEAGLSDHTYGLIAPVVAVSLGAVIIEKHFTLDKSIPSPDAPFSLDAGEFAKMVETIRQAESALGEVDYSLSGEMKANRRFGRSLFVVKDIKKGELFSEENIKSIRPSFGMHPKHLKEILGTPAPKDFNRGEPLIF